MAIAFSRTTRALAVDSSWYAMLTWLIGLLIISVWLVWFLFAQVTLYEVSSKARLEVNRSAHPIAVLTAGKIASVSVALGQEVAAGEVLLRLDSSSQQLRLQEEEAKIKSLPPQIAAMQKQINALEQAKGEDRQASLAAMQSARSRQKETSVAAAFAQDYAQRLSKLQAAGLGAVVETLRAGAEAKKLSSAGEALSADLQRIEMDGLTKAQQKQAEIENLKREAAKLNGELEISKVTIIRLQQEIDNHLIRAPASGKVGDLAALQPGAYVGVGDKLGSIVPESDLRIVADFPPAAVLGRIHNGQHAQMRLDGFPWTQFGTIPALVSRVGSEIRDNQVRVEFTPETDAESAIIRQHGLPGVIEVSIEQLSPALLILRKVGQLWTDNQPGSSLGVEYKPG